MRLSNYLKAVIFIAAFFFSKSDKLFAQLSKTETYKDIIQKAHNLTLQNDRTQALNILFTAIERENKRKNIQTELIKNFKSISEKFLFDEAQQNYELSLSTFRIDPSLAINQMKEALKIEPNNLNIVLGLARYRVAISQCKQAYKEIGFYLKFQKYLDELQLLMRQIKNCDPDVIEEAIAKSITNKNNELYKYMKVIEIEETKQQSKNNLMFLINELKKLDTNYPELNYFEWLVSDPTDFNFNEYGKKYLANCKNMSSTKWRQYMIDPNICKRVKEIEKRN